MDCSICCEKFNKSTHFKIECKTCENDNVIACRTCCKKYLIDNSINPKCMICKVEWDKEFLFDNFTKIFINKELKEIKENVLLEKEISKLPDTQEFAERMKLIRGLELQKKELYDVESKYLNKIRKIKVQIRDINNSISLIRTSKESKVKDFTCKCPIDNCKGFLDNKYICGLCDNNICKKCMEIKNDDHECDEGQIETIKLLKKDTKSCPKCGQLIYKIDGCDQMWCPPCHTTFSWRTGLIEEGQIHNPEYYRWMRANNETLPRNPRDIPFDPCGNNVIGAQVFINILRTVMVPDRGIDQIEAVQLFNMHRVVGHIDLLVQINNENNTLLDTQQRDLRVSYLLNEITKDTWKSKLQIIDKKQEKEKNFINVWNLLKIIIIEYIGKIVENRNSLDLKQIICDIYKQNKKIIKYCNTSFEKIGKMYTCVYPGITIQFGTFDNYKKYLIKKTNK